MPFGRIPRSLLKVYKTSKKQYRRATTTKNLKKAITNLGETKYAAEYLSNAFATITSIGWNYWDPIPGITEGTGIFDERIGRRIAITEFYMTGMLVGGCSNLATDDKYNCLRFVGVVTGSATPMGAATINDIIGKRMEGLEIEQKFLDKYIVLNTVGHDTTGYIPNVRLIKIYKRFKTPIIVDYSQGGVPNKQLIICALSDSGLAPSPGFTTGHIAFNYKDV